MPLKETLRNKRSHLKQIKRKDKPLGGPNGPRLLQHSTKHTMKRKIFLEEDFLVENVTARLVIKLHFEYFRKSQAQRKTKSF